MGEEENRESINFLREKNLHIICAVTLMAVLGVSSVAPALPRVAEALRISTGQVGLLITVFTFPGVILTPFTGILADRIGRKIVLVPSLLLFAIAGVACAFAPSFEMLLWSRFLQGIGAASIGSINVTLIGDLYDGSRRTEAMGYNASILSIGTASYPAIGGALAIFGWNYPFLLPVLAVPVALAVVFGLNNPEPKSTSSLKDYLNAAVESVLRPQALILFAASVITFILLYGAYLTFLPAFLHDRFGAATWQIGIILSTMSVVTAITSTQLKQLGERLGKRLLPAYGFGAYAVSIAIMPLMPGTWFLLIPVSLFGVAQGMNIPAITNLLAGLVPMEQRGAFMSINGMVLRLGQTLGPMIAGAFFAVIGLDGVFYASAVLAVLSLPLLASLRLFKETR